jgi:uncharacterized protein YacL
MKKILELIPILGLLVWVVSSIIISLFNLFDFNNTTLNITNSVSLLVFGVGYIIKNPKILTFNKQQNKSKTKKYCSSCK